MKSKERKLKKRGIVIPRFKKVSDSVAYFSRIFEGKSLKDSYQGTETLDKDEPLID